MSVWDAYQGGLSLPPGTPALEIRRVPTWAHTVLAAGQPVHTAATYGECHLWVQNNYRLTSTMMLPVHADYAAHMERDYPEPEPSAPPVLPEGPEGGSEQPANRFRKPGA